MLPDFPFNLLWPIAAPGQALETFVGEDVNTMLILNLLSGTEYSVKVIASYTTGSSEALTGKAKTCEFSFLYFDLTSQFLSCVFGSTSNFLLHSVLKQDKQKSLLWLYTLFLLLRLEIILKNILLCVTASDEIIAKALKSVHTHVSVSGFCDEKLRSQ